jgi:hypothetical protein
MVTISIRHDFTAVQKKLDGLSNDLQKRVIPTALNKIIAKGRTEMTRAISSEFKISQSEVRARLRLIRAKKDFAKWAAVLDPFASERRGRSLNLIHFVEKYVSLTEGRRRKKNKTLAQLRFQIKRTGGKKVIDGAFIGNKGRTVFVREGANRLPIKALSTIDVPQMFNTRRIQSRVIARINAEMEIEFDRAIKSAIGGFV